MPSSSNRLQQCRWHGYATTADLEQAALQAILRAAQQAIARHGTFRIVLAGGTTPRRIYEALRHADADWTAWHVYFSDERCLPPDHPERNSRMAAQAWLDHVAIPTAQVHPIPAELGAEVAAARYAQTVNAVATFDLALLGLGEDGHTASLFPGHDWGNTPNSPPALAVHDSPKPPPERVSLSAYRLGRAEAVMFLVTGESKRQAAKNWRNGVPIPAAAITPDSGVDVHIESELLQN